MKGLTHGALTVCEHKIPSLCGLPSFCLLHSAACFETWQLIASHKQHTSTKEVKISLVIICCCYNLKISVLCGLHLTLSLLNTKQTQIVLFDLLISHEFSFLAPYIFYDEKLLVDHVLGRRNMRLTSIALQIVKKNTNM